jgi:predicted  nucleic acid-binding Zn-ribbon protein
MGSKYLTVSAFCGLFLLLSVITGATFARLDRQANALVSLQETVRTLKDEDGRSKIEHQKMVSQLQKASASINNERERSVALTTETHSLHLHVTELSHRLAQANGQISKLSVQNADLMDLVVGIETQSRKNSAEIEDLYVISASERK